MLIASLTASAADSAKEMLADGRIDEAIAELNGRLSSATADAESSNLLCRAYYALEDWDRAESSCRKAVSLAPDDSRFHLWVGRAYGEKAERENFLAAAVLAAKVRDVLDAALAPARILVVEDEALIRMMMVDILGEAGFAAEEAANAAEAMVKLRAAIDRFDAVILDMGLPDRRGDQLTAELRTLRRDLPIVIASGMDKHHLEHLFAADPRVVVVAKPYLGEDLRQALKRLGVEAR